MVMRLSNFRSYCLGYYCVSESLLLDNEECLLEFTDLTVSLSISLTHLLEEIEIQSKFKNNDAIDTNKLRLILTTF